jgi:hypothetical protein
MTLGNIIRQAEQIRVPVPTVKMVYYALQEMNRQISESTQPLRIPEHDALANGISYLQHFAAQPQVVMAK